MAYHEHSVDSVALGPAVRSPFSLNGGLPVKIENKLTCSLNNQTKMFQLELNNYVWNQIFSALNLMSLVHGMYIRALFNCGLSTV